MTPVAASSPVSTYRLFRSDFIPKLPFLSLTKRNRGASYRFTVRASASATVESPNGVAASNSEIDSSSYGRQFFPLAAVVGQVREIYSETFVSCQFDPVGCRIVLNLNQFSLSNAATNGIFSGRVTISCGLSLYVYYEHK